MKRVEFEETVRKSEAMASADPKGYRRKLAALTALGYAYIWFMLLLFLAVLGGMLAFGYYAVTHGRAGGGSRCCSRG